MEEKILFTSESVSEGHPDKICDQISDAILDACLKLDPLSRVACECLIIGNYLLIAGEITCRGSVDYNAVARGVLRDIGYTKEEYGTNAETIKIDVRITEQSPDIAQGVDYRGNIKNMGAGDQGIMFGYASNECDEYMPLSITIAHKLVKRATELRKNGTLIGARPDMKSQVTVDYTNPENVRLDCILMSIQHNPDIDLDKFKKDVYELVMVPVVEEYHLNKDFRCLINPTGRFVIGGPAGDSGLTGRKLIVDTYGGASRHGGGSFSGKDPSKVDRSATYYARYIAKNLVAAGVAERLEIQLSYAIGISKVISISLSTFGTSHYDDKVILEVIDKVFDTRPGAIIETFSLTKPNFRYRDVTNYGHFGKANLPWEKLDKVNEIKKYLNK